MSQQIMDERHLIFGLLGIATSLGLVAFFWAIQTHQLRSSEATKYAVLEDETELSVAGPPVRYARWQVRVFLTVIVCVFAFICGSIWLTIAAAGHTPPAASGLKHTPAMPF